ncbi:hypothetical protein CFT9_06514 [Pseudomonas sp. CFT9]|nr:hypothetical protein CFT9_06514 [Pseudomonas sp. CFT9]
MAMALRRWFRVNEHRLLSPLLAEKSSSVIVAITRIGVHRRNAFIFI